LIPIVAANDGGADRYVIAMGFTIMGLALLYSSHLAPNIDFERWC